MPAAYPFGLRTIISASKARSQPAAFRVSDPRRGFAYFQASGTDTPVFWDVVFRFDECGARNFQLWFAVTLQRGVLDFDLPIKTEFGLVPHTCRFLPDGLLDANQIGEAWEYRARIAARSMTIPADALTAWGGSFNGPIPAQTILAGVPFSLNLASYFSGGLGPFAYSVETLGLPPGLALNRATGLVSGVPTVSTTLEGVVFSRTDVYCVRKFTDAVSFSGPPTDPYFANVALLLHAEGADGSTTLADSSQHADHKSTTPALHAISTGDARFGAASLRIQDLAAATALQWSGARFTLSVGGALTFECWFKVSTPQNLAEGPPLLRINDNAGSEWVRVSKYGLTNDLAIRFGSGDTAQNLGFTPGPGGWTHLAIVHFSGVTKVYAQGSLIRSLGSRDGNGTGLWAVYVGTGPGGGGGYAGSAFIDEVRFTQGVARYTADFTPPAEPFPNA